MNKQQTERLGVSKLDHFFSSCGWLFREQPIHDYGIDAQVEIVKNDILTGDLIAIQVKSGLSFFKEETDNSYIFRTDNKHIHYWTKYSLPVIIVLYHPEEDKIYWESINNNSILSTGKNWKVNIPKNKLLTEDSLSEIENLIQPLPDIQALNKFRFDKVWMELIKNDELVTISFLDWINKSLSRYQITIKCESRYDIKSEKWPTIYAPGSSVEEFLSKTIPWADFEIDEDEYRESVEADWDAECYMGHDKEDGTTYYSEPFENWYKEPSGIVPISSDGEVDHYRLILTLNNLGKAFLLLDEYLSLEDKKLKHAFNIIELDPSDVNIGKHI